MKCVFVSCFNAYDNRIKLIEIYLNKRGYECFYITSNFNHDKKTVYSINRDNTIQIEVIPYYKNFSINRLVSHYIFAKHALEEIKRIKPDLLYVMLPPNSLVRFVAKYRKKNKIKLIYDLYDLWPETFPSKKAKNLLLLPFKFWARLRDKGVGDADIVITECELFQKKLQNQLAKTKTTTLYPTKDKTRIQSIFDVNLNLVEVCYLGSINNIIDIKSISELLSCINKVKQVKLHIIGDGESRQQFIEAIESCGIHVVFYGRIYEDDIKKEIFDKCMFGLNMMKETVCVGLTLKSLDYFQAGLPIINNIKADTEQLVEKYGIGFNVTNSNMESVAERIATISKEELLAMRKNMNIVFDNLFSTESFENRLKKIFKMIEEDSK